MDITRWLREQECDLLHIIDDWFESKDGKEDRAMRMDAETMKRNGIVYVAIKELLALDLTATADMIAHFTDGAYNEKAVKKAVTSLEKQGLVTVDAHRWVTEVHPFPEAEAVPEPPQEG